MNPPPNPPLRSLLERIERSDLSPASLARALSETPDLAALTSAATFSKERYVRVSLHRCDAYEVRLLCWLPGQSSALHGHGEAACAFKVLQGEAQELRIGGGPVARLQAGQLAHVGAGVHQVANVGQEPLITLHVYAPPLPVDQPSQQDGYSITLLGGGWCGAALAMHLLQSQQPDLRVTLVERDPSKLGRGVAYSTTDPAHLLNVPAGAMSVDPRDPDEFVRYARARGVLADARSLLPRRLYGDYIEDRLARTIEASPTKLRVVVGEATSVEPVGDRWRVGLADGRAWEADDVVLATGHGRPRWPEALRPLAQDPAVISDPWAPGALSALDPDARVLLLGTGLTALDVLGTLRRQKHRAQLWAVSRHGRWPRPHLPSVVWEGPPVRLDLSTAPLSADGLARWLLSHTYRAGQDGLPWQAVLEALRPHVSTLWQRLTLYERRRFLDRHRSTWEVLRHRAPEHLLASVRDWHEEGWLLTRPGQLAQAKRQDGALRVEVERYGVRASLEVDHIILCTGTDPDLSANPTPLWASLLERGLVCPDPLGQGILTHPNSAILGPDGASRGLWALGAHERPRLLEATSVPDLARLSAALCANLLARAAERACERPRRASIA